MLKIDKLYAFVAVDSQGNEGVCAFMAGRSWMPMVAADSARIKSLYPIAQQISRESNQTIRLIEFSTRKQLDIITPIEK